MKFKDYLEATRRTWNVLPNKEDNISHALLGIIDECGELASQYKKSLAYGKDLLVHKGKGCVKEELGDLMYFITRLLDELEFKNFKELLTDVEAELNKEVVVPKHVTSTAVLMNMADSGTGIFRKVARGEGQEIVVSSLTVIGMICMLAEIEELDIRNIMQTNIDKLKVRFPDKFTNENANNRDLSKEEEVIDGNE